MPMTPTELSPSTEQDVAGLVAEAAAYVPFNQFKDGPLVAKLATALSTLAAERDEAKREATVYHGYWIEERDKRITSEARATALEGERDALKNTMRLHAGDTISLDNDARTANEEAGYWMAEALADRAQLARAREALEAEAKFARENLDAISDEEEAHPSNRLTVRQHWRQRAQTAGEIAAILRSTVPADDGDIRC